MSGSRRAYEEKRAFSLEMTLFRGVSGGGSSIALPIRSLVGCDKRWAGADNGVEL